MAARVMKLAGRGVVAGLLVGRVPAMKAVPAVGASAPAMRGSVRGMTAAAASDAFVVLDESKQTLDDLMAKNSKVLAYFTASWCGPCRAIAPHFQTIAEANKGKVTFVKIDVDDNPEAAQGANISAVPTFKAMHGGKVLREFSGANIQSLKDTAAALAEAA